MTTEEKAKKNGSEEAYARPSSVHNSSSKGLTKRELFAKDVLCALITNADRHSQDGDCQVWNYEHLSEIALNAADALLLKLYE